MQKPKQGGFDYILTTIYILVYVNMINKYSSKSQY